MPLACGCPIAGRICRIAMSINRDALRQKLLEMKSELERQEAMSEAYRATVELDQQSVGRLSRS